MFSKKNNYTFTIRFDPRIPEQKQAADMLNKLGRKKAVFVANAINKYMEFPLKTRYVSPTQDFAIPPEEKANPAKEDVYEPEVPNIPFGDIKPQGNENLQDDGDSNYSEILAAINGFNDFSDDE